MSSIDVIIPCYNYGRFLAECVASVLGQSGPPLRVLVIDDASVDDTAAVAAALAGEDNRVNVIRHRENRGHIHTYNEGIEWASAEYLLILSADDYILPGALRRATTLMDAHPNVGFTFGEAFETTEGFSEVRNTMRAASVGDEQCQRIFSGLEFIKRSSHRNIVCTSSAVVRAEMQKRIGGYRRELPHSGDMEMWLRFAAHGDVGFIGTLQSAYRRHNHNMSNNYFENGWLPDFEQRKAAFEWFFQNCGPRLENADKLRRELMYSLALSAVSHAGSAFNRQQFELSDRLLALAADASPQVTRSPAWMKLACKRCFGYHSWALARPIVHRARRAAASIFGPSE